MPIFRHFAVSMICLLIVNLATAEDVLITDFEGDTYGQWKLTGEAFGVRPANGTLPGQMSVTGFHGKGLVNSFAGGDGSKGNLTSPVFKIQRRYVNFLVGGGAHQDRTCINLVLDGKIVRSATGPNDRSGGSENLVPVWWDVKEFAGRDVTLQIVDDESGGWGHINVDHIVQSDTSVGDEAKFVPTSDRSRELLIAERYLLFPISNSVRPSHMTVTVAGKVIHDFEINLANDKPDWWARLDVPQATGQTATITAFRVPDDSKGLELIESSAAIRHSQPLYNEALRPQLRFSQMQGWNNDPNGMVFHEGEYHFFWQSNPFGPQWGNMYWGHAVSRDLVHWEELPYALYPRVMAKSHCFSGSAHVDEHNSGGWQIGDEKTLVAAFTDTGSGETLAISNDRGRSWKYIEENPVIPQRQEGRDPKLIWYEPGKHWVIAVYTKIGDTDFTEFYRSTNLKQWEKTGQLAGYFECPELFELPVDGDAKNKRWVLFAANAEYAVGQFDGKSFVPEHEGKHKLHHGSFYASQCFSQVPGGRVIQVGWARMDFPDMPFNQAFSLPIELTLKSTADGVRMCGEPIRELETLRGTPKSVNDAMLSKGKPLSIPLNGQLFDIVATIQPGDASEVAIQFGRNVVTYKAADHTLDGMPITLTDGAFDVRIVIDRPLYEIVGQNGAVYKTTQRNDGGENIDAITISATGVGAKVESLNVYPMQSIWKK